MLQLSLFRRRAVHLVRQSERAECGLACLTMIANYYGLSVDIGTVRRHFPLSARGTSLRYLISLAEEIGLTTRALKAPLDELAFIPLPAILHWDMNHYVVLEAVKGDRYLVHDPNGSSSWLPLTKVSQHFTGIILEASPSPDFQPAEQQARLKINQLFNRVQGLKRALLQVAVLTALLQATIMALPYFSQVAIDRIIASGDRNLLAVLSCGFLTLALISAIISLFRDYVLLYVGTIVGFSISSNMARHLLRLPIAWFERRHSGDILSRFQSIKPIQQFLSEGCVSAGLDGVTALITLVLMLIYSPPLAFIAVAAVLAYALIRSLFFRAQQEAQQASIVAGGLEQTTIIESIRGITTLRLFGLESLRHSLWQARRTDALNADVRILRLGIFQSAANASVFGFENIATIWLAVTMILNGAGISIGMLFAFIAYKTQFTQKMSTLLDQFIAFQMLRLHLDRLSDIAFSELDRAFAIKVNDKKQLAGNIRLRDVAFRYSPTDPLTLDGIDLAIGQGEHVSITGPSGIGKTTILKIIAGLLEIDLGQVLVDGIDLKEFGIRNYQSQIAVVMQSDELFAGTIAENIALFEDTIDMARVVSCAEAAAIHDDILTMPMQYDMLVAEHGSSLSGGQKQRLLLARALYREPRILMMDEGTAHLDAACEHRVNIAIAAMGITRIVVAHRSETIAAADRVIVLDSSEARDASVSGTRQIEPA